MKKLTQAFLWTCTALFLGQVGILTMAAVKGHLTSETVTHLVALLSGINIRSEQIGAAIRDARTAPMPTAEEVNQARAKATLDSDTKMLSLNRREDELREREKRLNDEKIRHDSLVAEYKRQVENTKVTADGESLQKVMGLIQALDPPEAKIQLSKMLEKEKKDDVISILTTIDADKQKKILAEFTEEKDRDDLAEILAEIRNRGKASQD